MKKILFLIGICAVLISMPAISAISFTTTKSLKNDSLETAKTFPIPIEPDYDGTFIGTMGTLWKEDGEWQFEAAAYIAGVYKGGNYKRVFANIYNLDEEQVGSMWFISGRNILVGRIQNMNEEKAPIVGFLFYNEQYFIGRIMSLFGPAPHIWGEYTPN